MVESSLRRVSVRAAVLQHFVRERASVSVGDQVSCYAEIVSTGRTSMVTRIETWVRRREGGDPIKVTEGEYTYVKLGDDKRPAALPERGE